MEYIAPGLLVLSGIVFLSIYLTEQRKLKAEKKDYLTLLSTYGTLKEENGRYFFNMHGEDVEICFFILKQNEELILNSRVMWEIFRMKKAMIVDQTEFLSGPLIKWIIIYPSTAFIKRYINENEMEFLKPEDVIYDYQIISGFDLERFLKEKTDGI